MERILTMEEKIKRAEEIYSRRKNNAPNIYNTKENTKSHKEIKLFKRVTFQIVVCLSIYFFYYAVNNNYIFSKDLIQKTQSILSYDINFNEIYNNCINFINGLYSSQENNREAENDVTTENNKQVEQKDNDQSSIEEQTSEEENNITEENSIGGAKVENVEEIAAIEQEQSKEESSKEMSQEERDILEIKNNISFIKPIEGTISSTFGWRNPTTATVPKYHTGLDIAAPTGTVIKSATDGIVSLVSNQGDYR